MAKEVIYVSRKYKEIKSDFVERKTLELDTSPNLDFFLFTLALGIDNPADEVPSKDGLTRYSYFKTKDKAILASALLGTARSDDEVENYIDFDKCTDYCEKCAERGIYELRRLYTEADCDEELLERRMMAELDRIYKSTVLAEVDDI